MRFTLEIHCDGAAFCDDDGDPAPEQELVRILRALACDIMRTRRAPHHNIHDVNLNRVGDARLIEE